MGETWEWPLIRQLPGGGRASGTQWTSIPFHCFQEDTRAQRQRLQKHLAEHLRQTWGRPGPPQQARDLGELLQAWGAGARPGAPKGSRFTHSKKFTFHLVGGAKGMLMAPRLL